MGSRVPPAVTATPAPVCSWSRVAETITVTGSPRCSPNFGSPSCPRTNAASASCWRWAWLRASRSITCWLGSPVTVGVWSSGLHIPGAANLAAQASSMARSSGVATRRPTLIPSGPWPPLQVNPRLRARSASEKSPSGLRRSANWAASFSNWSGRSTAACSARNASALSASAGETWSGSSRTKRWMVRRCSRSSAPECQALAVAANCGATCWPVTVVRGANWVPAMTRRPASPGLIRSTSAMIRMLRAPRVCSSRRSAAAAPS